MPGRGRHGRRAHPVRDAGPGVNGESSPVGEPDSRAGNAEWYGALVAPGLPAIHAATRHQMGALDGDVVERAGPEGTGACQVSAAPSWGTKGANAGTVVTKSPRGRAGGVTSVRSSTPLCRQRVHGVLASPSAQTEAEGDDVVSSSRVRERCSCSWPSFS